MATDLDALPLAGAAPLGCGVRLALTVPLRALACPTQHWALAAILLLTRSGGGFGGPVGVLGGGSSTSRLVQWVEAHGTLVPASAYGGTSGATYT